MESLSSSGGYDLASIRARAKGHLVEEQPHQTSTLSLDAGNHNLDDSSSSSSDSEAILTEEKVERFDSSKKLGASDDEGSDDELSRTFAPLDGEAKPKPAMKRMNSADTFDSNDSELDLSKTFANTDFSKIAILPKVHDDSDDSSDSSNSDQGLTWQKSLSFNGRRTSDGIDDNTTKEVEKAPDDVKQKAENSISNLGEISSSSSDGDSSSDDDSVRQKSPQSPPGRQMEHNNTSFSSAKAPPPHANSPLRASYKAAKVSDPSAFESSVSKLSFSKAPEKSDVIPLEKSQAPMSKDEPIIPTTDDLVHMKLDVREHLAMLTKQNAELFTQLSKRDEECVEAIHEKDKLAMELQTASFREAEAVVFLRCYRRFYRNLVQQSKAPKSSIVPSTEELIDMDRLMMEAGFLEPDEVGVDNTGNDAKDYVPSEIAVQMSKKQATKMQQRLNKVVSGAAEKDKEVDAASSSSSEINESQKELEGAARETPAQLEARSKELGTPAGRFLLTREDELENGLMLLTAKYLDLKQWLFEQPEKKSTTSPGDTSGSGIFSSMMSITKSSHPPEQPDSVEATDEGAAPTKGAQAQELMAVLRQLNDVQSASQVTRDKLKMQTEEMAKMQTMLSSTQEKYDKLQAQLQRQRGAAGRYQAVVWKLKDVQAESDMHLSSLEEKKKECAALENKLATMQGKCKKLEIELANAITQKHALHPGKNNSHEFEAKLQEAETRYTELEEASEALLSSKDELIAKANHELFLAQERLDDVESKESSAKSLLDLQKKKIESLESEIDSMRENDALSIEKDDEISKVRHELSVALERIENFESVESKRDFELTTQTETVSRLREELDDAKQQCLVLEEQLVKVKQDHALESEQYQESIASLQKQQFSLETQETDSAEDNLVDDLNSGQSESGESLSDTQLKYQESQERCQHLKSEMEQMSSRYHSQLEEMNNNILTLKQDLSQSLERIQHLEKELEADAAQGIAEGNTEDDGNESVEEYSGDRTRILKAEIQDYKIRNKSLEEELSRVVGERSSLMTEQQGTILQLQEELSEASKRFDTFKQDGLIEKERQIDELELKLQENMDRCKELEEKLEQLKAENSSLREDHTSVVALQKQLSDERERCRALEEEREQNIASAADFLRELSEYQQRCKSLENELKEEGQNSAAESERYTERIAKLETELSEAQEVHEFLKGKIQSLTDETMVKTENPYVVGGTDGANGEEGDNAKQSLPTPRPRNGSLVSVDSLSVSGLAPEQDKSIFDKSYEKSQDFFGEVPSPPKTYKPKYQIREDDADNLTREDVILEEEENDEKDCEVPSKQSSSEESRQDASTQDNSASGRNEQIKKDKVDVYSTEDQLEAERPISTVRQESIVAHSDEGSGSELSAITMDPNTKAKKKKKKAKEDRKKADAKKAMKKAHSKGSLLLDDEMSKSSKISRQGSKSDFSTLSSRKKKKKSKSKSTDNDDEASRMSKSSRVSKSTTKADKPKKHKSKKSSSKDDETVASTKSSKAKKHKSKRSLVDYNSSKNISEDFANADL